jgi:hypothetical protein
MTAHAEDMVLIPRAELEALRAENRRLRRESGDREALKRIRSDSGEGRTFTREELLAAGRDAPPTRHHPGRGGLILGI